MLITDTGLAAHRAQFPGLAQRVYLNFGARGVMSSGALQAVAQSLETLQSIGPASRAGNAWVEYEVSETRQALAELLGVAHERIALVDSVSTACAVTIWGISWHAGDHALICASEPPGTWATLRQAAQRFGFEVTAFAARHESPHLDPLDDLAKQLRPNTRLIVASHVDWVSGSQLAVEALAAVVRRGPCPRALILIDGAQAVGAIPVRLDDTQIDAYAFGTQKWLCGPDGVAALYVRKEAQIDCAPTVMGWRGIEPTPDGLDIRLATGARRYESGSGAYCLLSSVRRAIALPESIAPAAVRAQRIAELTRRLRDRIGRLQGADTPGNITVLDSPIGAGITSMRIRHTSPAWVQRSLESNGFVVRQHYVPPCIRVCVHYFTLAAEVDAFCDALAAVTLTR